MTKVNLIESPYPLQSIKGLGPKRIALLQELNINTVEDLVLYLPTRYEDNTVVDLNMAERSIYSYNCRRSLFDANCRIFGRNKSKLTVHLMVDNIAVKCIFFNQPYLKRKLNFMGR